MNEVINIQIAGQIFYIDKQAYDDLKTYLASIQSTLSPHEDQDEIMKDIEVRIAELFLKKLSDSKQNLERKDVEEIKKIIGMVDSEESENNSRSSQFSDDQSKARLFRIPEEGFIAGVCTGISKRYNIHVFIIRLLFVLFIFAMGLSVVLYLIFWAVLKTPESVSQRIESRGEIPTFDSIVQEFKSEDHEPKKSQIFQKILFFPFFIIGFIIKTITSFFNKNNRLKKAQRIIITLFSLLIAIMFTVLLYQFNEHLWMPSIQQNIISLIFPTIDYVSVRHGYIQNF